MRAKAGAQPDPAALDPPPKQPPPPPPPHHHTPPNPHHHPPPPPTPPPPPPPPPPPTSIANEAGPGASWSRKARGSHPPSFCQRPFRCGPANTTQLRPGGRDFRRRGGSKKLSQLTLSPARQLADGAGSARRRGSSNAHCREASDKTIGADAKKKNISSRIARATGWSFRTTPQTRRLSAHQGIRPGKSISDRTIAAPVVCLDETSKQADSSEDARPDPGQT